MTAPIQRVILALSQVEHDGATLAADDILDVVKTALLPVEPTTPGVLVVFGEDAATGTLLDIAAYTRATAAGDELWWDDRQGVYRSWGGLLACHKREEPRIYVPADAAPVVQVYRATWDDVSSRDDSDLMALLAWAEREYLDNSGDPGDDPDYSQPVLAWRLCWQDGQRVRLALHARGRMTAMHVDRIGGAV